MSDRVRTFSLVAICLGAVCVLAAPASAKKAINVKADFTAPCPNCETDWSGTWWSDMGIYYNNPNGPYSVQDSPSGTSYEPGSTVTSQILTHNKVYTLQTNRTSWTRSVLMHFFSSVSGDPQYPDNVLPSCWAGDPDQNWPINLSVFSNNLGFPDMQVGSSYSGWARVQFNNLSSNCDTQINFYNFEWYGVCITHPSSTSWVITTDACGAQINYGTGNLKSQGGKKHQTVNYGDWRVPFQLTLTTQ